MKHPEEKNSWKQPIHVWQDLGRGGGGGEGEGEKAKEKKEGNI